MSINNLPIKDNMSQVGKCACLFHFTAWRQRIIVQYFYLISIRLLYTILLVFRNIFITSWLQFFTHFSYETLSKFDTEFTHICEAAHTIAKVKMIRFLCFYFSPIPPDTTVNKQLHGMSCYTVENNIKRNWQDKYTVNFLLFFSCLLYFVI